IPPGLSAALGNPLANTPPPSSSIGSPTNPTVAPTSLPVIVALASLPVIPARIPQSLSPPTPRPPPHRPLTHRPQTRRQPFRAPSHPPTSLRIRPNAPSANNPQSEIRNYAKIRNPKSA